ncbi:MAG TPA: RNA polymerase sigma factor [Blastocatellia bacterium]|nr:RNA polymerase sigma factor [Blastocatellia bacterium]
MNVSEDLQSDEAGLIRDACRGDSSAFKAIYDRYGTRIYNLIFYWFGDDAVAEDLLQIVFMKAFQGLPAFRHDSSLSTWLYRIALNQCTNHARRGGGRYAPLDAILGSDHELAPGPLPDEHQALTEKQEIVAQAVRSLSPKLRAVVVMRYNDGLSYDEIAEILGCSPGTVASRLSRALSQLDAKLRPLRSIL